MATLGGADCLEPEGGLPALLAGAAADVPPPPAPYYDENFEQIFPAEQDCGHNFKEVVSNHEDCVTCHAILAAMMKNRERPANRAAPQDRAGERGARFGQAYGSGKAGGKGGDRSFGSGPGHKPQTSAGPAQPAYGKEWLGARTTAPGNGNERAA